MRSGALAMAGALTLTVLVPLTAQTARAADATAPLTTTKTAVAASATTSRPAYRLALGSKGTAVYRLEKKLRMKGANGVYGWATVKRVKSIERWGGLPRDGVVDAKTQVVINKYIAKKRAAMLKARKAAAAKAKTVNGRLAKIVRAARSNFGRPYARGASGPSAFDCSGFTRYVVRQALGKSLPHQSGAQRGTVKKISRSQAKPGDLVFFHGGGGVYHVGIYAGRGKLFHASRPGTRSGIGPIFSSNVSFGRVA
jgi:cell wall-associated NlpC family hydrolase